jgi:hypothetical protein
MRGLKLLGVTAVIAGFFVAGSPAANAQMSAAVGAAPACPYGYFDVAPYECAPSGYYGPEWFNGESFIGAGPWFHGSKSFRGNVNNTYHPHNGYKGTLPNRGEKAEPTNRVTSASFKGNEERDGRGNVTGGKR